MQFHKTFSTYCLYEYKIKHSLFILVANDVYKFRDKFRAQIYNKLFQEFYGNKLIK